MADDVQILGLEEVCAKLREMSPKIVRQALKDCLEASGSVLQVAQMEAAPIDVSGEDTQHPPGQLKQDIRRVVKLYPSEGKGVVTVAPSRHSFYGMFAEFGTSHQPAHPWMRPSFEAAAPEAIAMFEKVLAAYIEIYGKGGK
jgi:HK97 gp10 family phage protein